MSAPDPEAIARVFPRFVGATADHPAITHFLDEVRQAGRRRGLITAKHIEVLETVLANACFAASEDPGLIDLWDAIVAIMRNGRPVKERLADFGRIGEAFDEQRRGRTN